MTEKLIRKQIKEMLNDLYGDIDSIDESSGQLVHDALLIKHFYRFCNRMADLIIIRPSESEGEDVDGEEGNEE